MYKCIACGPDQYWIEGWDSCIYYPIPPWIKQRGLCSGGICYKTLNDYMKLRGKSLSEKI